MTTIVYIVLGIVGVVFLVSIVWRRASRRWLLPCPTWLGWLVEFDSPFSQYGSRGIISNLGLQSGMKVLDVGCGPGRLAIPIAQQVGSNGEVVAIDIQPGMLRRAKEKASKVNVHNIQFLQVEVGEGTLGSNLYDRALLVTVLGEIPKREAALKGIFDALKPAGLLSVTEIILDPHFQKHKSVLKLAGAIGFKEKSFFGNSFVFTSILEKPLAP